MRQTHVGVLVDERFVRRADRCEVGFRELLAARQRCTLALAPADDALLLLELRAVPGLDDHADLADHEIGAAAQPAGGVTVLHPHLRLDRLRLLGLHVRGAVLEAEQVARGDLARGRGGRATEAELRPADGGASERDAAQVADRVDGDLRVVGARLDAEVAAGEAGLQVVSREAGQLLQLGRPTVGDAEAVGAVLGAEERGAEPEGDREPAGGEPERFSGVDRGSERGTVDGATRRDLLPLRHPCRGDAPVLEQLDELLPGGARRHVVGGEVQPVLSRRRDPALVRSGERVHGGDARAACRGCRGRRDRRRRTRACRKTGGPGSGQAEERPTRETPPWGVVRRRGRCLGFGTGGGSLLGHRTSCYSGVAGRPRGRNPQNALSRSGPVCRDGGGPGGVYSATPSTVWVSCESGSARALTWSDSSLRWSSVTVS